MTAPSVLLVSHFDEADHAHARQRARAFQRLGCDVTTFDLGRKPGLLGRLKGADVRKRLEKSLAEAEANLIVVVGGYELDDEAVAVLKNGNGARLAACLPHDLTRLDDAVRVARAYDLVFAAGSDVAGEVGRAIGREVEVLPLAADPSVYRPLRSRDQYRANVVFAGTATPTREAYLAALVEFGLALWGPGWRRTSLRDYCRGETKDTAEYVRAYGGASVAINVHRDVADVGANDRAFCNQRVFELAGMGAPQVVDARADLPGYFEPSRHLLTFRTSHELKVAVEALLHDPPRAEAMATECRQHFLAHHTHMHRARRLLDRAGVGGGRQGPTRRGDPLRMDHRCPR